MDATGRIGYGRWVAGALAMLALAWLAGCHTPNNVLRQQGIDALNAGNVERADERFSLAFERDPADWKALYYIGVVRLKQSRPLDAEVALEKAQTLRPSQGETPAILDSLAESLLRQNKAAQLNTMLRQAVSDYGTVHDYLRQGDYLARLGDPDSAKGAYLKAIHFADPSDTEPFLKLADFYDSLGDRKNALDILCQAYYIDPNSKAIADRIRKHDVVPGWTIRKQPER